MVEPARELEWLIANFDVEAPLEEVLMTQRGHVTPEQQRSFLEPRTDRDCHSPFDLPDMDEALQRLDWALRWRELIVIFGDYDADGITATVLLKEALERMGGRVEYIIPHRLKGGYGLNPDGVDRAVKLGAGVIVTVDNGVTAYEGAQRAAEAGIDLIVTDHHQPGPHLPEARAVVDPNLEASKYPFGGLAGVGVVLKLVQALCSLEHPRGEVGPPTAGELELTALGTVADVSPMVDENRALVREGLLHLSGSKRPGFEQLLVATRQAGKVDTQSVGFALAPRLNAAGRMEAADMAVELLLSPDPARCLQLVQKLELVNEKRKSVTEDNTALARTIVEKGPERFLPVVHHASFHPGVAGLVAGRLMERYQRPVLVLTSQNGLLTGSARSPPGFDITAALAKCQDLLISHGGHPAAAGVRLEPGEMEPLQGRLDELAGAWLDQKGAGPTLHIDSLVEPEALVLDLFHRLETLAPFGRKNERPVLALDSVRVDRAIPIGRGKNHLRLEVNAGNRRLKGVGWNMGAWARRLSPGQPIGLAFALEREAWRGREGLQLNIKGLQTTPNR